MISNKLKQNKNLAAVLKKIIVPILMLTIIAGVFAPQYQAGAAGASGTWTDDTSNGATWYQVCPFSLIACVTLVREGVGRAISWSAGLLDSFIELSSFKPPEQVQKSWETVRNITNMFFILILIVMAFGTIFDLEKYSWRQMLVPFLIAAIFINFSFVIGTYILDISNGLASIFLKTIKDNGVSLSATLANGLALNKLGAPGAEKMSALIDQSTSPIITGLFLIVFMVIALMAMLSAAIFTLVRIPFIWFLLIISPFAWFSYAFPNLKAAGWSRWWKEFLCWCFFLPTYIFILMFAVIFIGAKQSGLAEISAQQNVLTSTTYGNAMANIFQIMGLNDIFFFVVTLIIMVGGLGIAKSVACKGSGLAVTAFGKIEGGVKGALKRLPVIRSGISAYRGAEQTVKRVGQEGLPGRMGVLYGGERAEKLRTGGWEGRFSQALGYTPELKVQKQQVSDIDAEVNRLKDLEKAGQITVNTKFAEQTRFTDAGSVKGAAMRALLLEKGMISEGEFDKSMTKWTSNNPFLAQSMSERAAKGKYGAVKPDTLLDMAAAKPGSGYDKKYGTGNARSARKEWFKNIQDNDKALNSGKFDVDTYDIAMDLMGGENSSEGRDFKKAVSEKRPDIVGQYKARTDPTFRDNPVAGIYDVIKTKDPRTVAKYLSGTWENTSFKNALTYKINMMNELPGIKVRGKVMKPGEIFKTNLERSVSHDGDKLKIAQSL